MKNVIMLRRVHELEPHVMPANTTGSVLSDFVAFWSGVDWSAWFIRALCLVLLSMFAGWGYDLLSVIDWSAVLMLLGVVR